MQKRITDNYYYYLQLVPPSLFKHIIVTRNNNTFIHTSASVASYITPVGLLSINSTSEVISNHIPLIHDMGGKICFIVSV